MQRILLAILVYLMMSQSIIINCYSVEPDEFLQNPKKELRARNISKNIRCLVCQNQSIDESSAPLAKDLRILIRIKIEQGNSDEEIYDFLTKRYGDFILLNPPLKISTLFLWILPFVFLAIGIFVIFLHNNKSKKLDYNK
jgi:cytochrome c-type biogenesis protein CcmH